MKTMRTLGAALSMLLASNAVMADENTDIFVEANMLATLYHELGHAMIDLQQMPIFGQEEDAADVLSVLLINAFYDEEEAVSLAYDTAFGFLGEDERAKAEGYAPAWWDVHGPDLQRYYNLVCLFYGANPEERDDVASELGLPEQRAESCPDEFALADASWSTVLDEMTKGAPSDTFRLGRVTDADSPVAVMVKAEIEALNSDFALAGNLDIHIESCGEANAFYNPQDRSITLCTEYADYLAKLAP